MIEKEASKIILTKLKSELANIGEQHTGERIFEVAEFCNVLLAISVLEKMFPLESEEGK